jgi:hypothetical protein
MSKPIEITGLTRRQQQFCAVLWALDTVDAVEDFIRTLPADQQMECRTIMQLMIAECLDDVADVQQAADVLRSFML